MSLTSLRSIPGVIRGSCSKNELRLDTLPIPVCIFSKAHAAQFVQNFYSSSALQGNAENKKKQDESEVASIDQPNQTSNALSLNDVAAASVKSDRALKSMFSNIVEDYSEASMKAADFYIKQTDSKLMMKEKKLKMKLPSFVAEPEVVDIHKRTFETWISLFANPEEDEHLNRYIATLNDFVFGTRPRVDLMQRAVVWYLAGKRAGTASTKRRWEVRGSNRKVRQQKGSGMARQGHNRAPHRRGGGKAFGPKPRDFSFAIPKRILRLALRSAIATRYQQGDLYIIDSFFSSTGKTKHLQYDLLRNRLWSALIVDTTVQENAARAIRNLHRFAAKNVNSLTVYDILRYPKLVMTWDAVRALEEKFIRKEIIYNPAELKRVKAFRNTAMIERLKKELQLRKERIGAEMRLRNQNQRVKQMELQKVGSK